MPWRILVSENVKLLSDRPAVAIGLSPGSVPKYNNNHNEINRHDASSYSEHLVTEIRRHLNPELRSIFVENIP